MSSSGEFSPAADEEVVNESDDTTQLTAEEQYNKGYEEGLYDKTWEEFQTQHAFDFWGQEHGKDKETEASRSTIFAVVLLLAAAYWLLVVRSGQ